MNDRDRAALLIAHGAKDSEIEELLSYNQNVFSLDEPVDLRFPLPDELFVESWHAWADEASDAGVYAVLQRNIPQLQFPIAEGISQSSAYRKATLQGADPGEMTEATGLELVTPKSLELVIHASVAGRLPVLITRERQDFVALIRALSARNEPVDVPEAKGAAMVAGFNNWARIEALRQSWLAGERHGSWAEEFARIRARRELYQDRFMILSDGPYSGVPASELGLGETAWRQLSLQIRREHECVHYFTRRVFDSMRNHLLDELVADYVGIVAACGRFRADWFLRFMGLENFPDYRAGGRLEIYRGDPPLSDGAFRVLQRLLVSAARNLEAFAAEMSGDEAAAKAATIAALASQQLEDLASPQAEELFRRAFDRLRRQFA